jgi:2TM domain
MVSSTAASAAAAAKTYSSEDVQHILQAALAYQSDRPFSQSQLKEMAAELNISAEVLAQAEATWQTAAAERQGAIAAAQQRRKAYRQQLGSYLVVNTGLILINLATCGTVSWAIYPLLGWGLGLCLGPNQTACGRRRSARAAQPATPLKT